jgi:hypothetical protein
MAAMLIGLFVVGLRHGQSQRRANYSAVIVVIVVVAVEAAKIHAI